MALIDHIYIADKLVAGDAGNTAEKGAALEEVVAETLCQLEGVGVIKRNILDNAGSLEIDILLYNHRLRDGLPFLPTHLIIECKNWQAPVNSATLTVFTGKLRKFRVDFGILVAANGITGDAQDRTAAHAHLRSVYDRDGLAVIVITRAEIEALRDTEDLGLLMREKYGDCIMGADQF
ncbi:restriction endonuclease [Pseudomonas sp. NFACC46-3]|uniref:restriction endonuclease n=1 Tax=Pseudomonas sp. NFACC46-3 TaxID=1566200 RepID=UPI0008E95D37|nr:restriction endonuclease [Pseudomonas sp. NFACC46-3]SFL41319.1 Restriction endonuclease [Pseudomonas sp. NFACC46-3]